MQSEETTPPEPAPLVVVRLDTTGRLAVILSSPGESQFSAPPAGRSQVGAFTRTGVRKVLDEAPVSAIPKASLTLRSGAIGWINAGQPKSVPAP